VKPRLWMSKRTWYCQGRDTFTWGDTAAIAYARWLMTVTLRRARACT
jgi:hypothetical protein